MLDHHPEFIYLDGLGALYLDREDTSRLLRFLLLAVVGLVQASGQDRNDDAEAEGGGEDSRVQGRFLCHVWTSS